MNKKNLLIGILSGVGIGVGLMYLLDPEKGRDRRVLLQDKASNALAKTSKAIATVPQTLQSQLSQTIEDTKTSFGRALDELLVSRVYSRIKPIISNPKSLEITAQNGCVVLKGSIAALYVGDLLKCISSVRGVKSIENRLDIHSRKGDVLDSVVH